MRIGSLFSGIGGLELGLEMSGLGQVVWQVEQNDYCSSVLARHWPSAERFEDVKEVGSRNLSEVDIICGGFPCQDISGAGKGAGLSGSRSGLWYEYARIVKECTPRWVIVENVASGAKRWINSVSEDLGKLGYETLPIPISAFDVGAPHLRKRIFIVACYTHKNLKSASAVDEEAPRVQSVARSGASHAECEQLREQPRGRLGASRESEAQLTQPSDQGPTPHSSSPGLQNGRLPIRVHATQPKHASDPWQEGPAFSPVCGVDDGIYNRVERLRALGNAVVPQCAEVIGHIVQELDSKNE